MCDIIIVSIATTDSLSKHGSLSIPRTWRIEYKVQLRVNVLPIITTKRKRFPDFSRSMVTLTLGGLEPVFSVRNNDNNDNNNNNNNYYYYYYYYYGIIERFFSWIQKRCLQRLTNSNENKNNEKLCTIEIKKNYSKILKW